MQNFTTWLFSATKKVLYKNIPHSHTCSHTRLWEGVTRRRSAPTHIQGCLSRGETPFCVGERVGAFVGEKRHQPISGSVGVFSCKLYGYPAGWGVGCALAVLRLRWVTMAQMVRMATLGYSTDRPSQTATKLTPAVRRSCDTRRIRTTSSSDSSRKRFLLGIFFHRAAGLWGFLGFLTRCFLQKCTTKHLPLGVQTRPGDGSGPAGVLNPQDWPHPTWPQCVCHTFRKVSLPSLHVYGSTPRRLNSCPLTSILKTFRYIQGCSVYHKCCVCVY